MEKLANAVAESFMEKYPNVTVSAEFTGSGAGIESLTAGSVDIGNSSRNLKDEEKDQSVRISTVLGKLDEISNDPNIPVHARTLIWEVLSKLEAI